MKRTTAIALAITEMKHSIQHLAVDANRHERLGSRDNAAVSAHKQRANLREAIVELELMSEETKHEGT